MMPQPEKQLKYVKLCTTSLALLFKVFKQLLLEQPEMIKPKMEKKVYHQQCGEVYENRKGDGNREDNSPKRTVAAVHINEEE